MELTEFQRLVVDTPVNPNETLFILVGRTAGTTTALFNKLMHYRKSIYYSPTLAKVVMSQTPTLYSNALPRSDTNEIVYSNGNRVKVVMQPDIARDTSYCRGSDSLMIYDDGNYSQYRGSNPYCGQVVVCTPMQFISEVAPKLSGCYKIITGYGPLSTDEEHLKRLDSNLLGKWNDG